MHPSSKVPRKPRRTLSRIAVWCAGALTIASVLLISFDVLARKFLGFTTGGAENPTLTIVTLAIRQADYIARQMTARAI